MDESSPNHPEPFLLLWLLGAALAVLACHLALGYARRARRQYGRAARAGSVAAGALAWGTGIMAAMALSVASQPLAFVVGYSAALLAATWAGAVAIAAVPPLLLAWRLQRSTALIGGAVFGVGVTAAEAGLLWAAGPLPGLVWRIDSLVLAACVASAGAAAALWMALVGPGRAGRQRHIWRGLAAVVGALGLMTGIELVQSAGDLATQIGSAHSGELSTATFTLIVALLAPVALVLLAGVLHLGRQPGGDEDSTLAPGAVRPGRRRRRKRTLWQRLFP
jgi:NO-binding membrane sensor protein with MHYT domain